jgi:hypothetical protein
MIAPFFKRAKVKEPRTMLKTRSPPSLFRQRSGVSFHKEENPERRTELLSLLESFSLP